MSAVHDVHVAERIRLITPKQLEEEIPLTAQAAQTVVAGREAIKRILSGEDKRLLMVIGPCSIHDPKGAMEYARRLAELRQKYAATMEIIMRVYFEKPRTTVGWKGLIDDPHLNGTHDIEAGLKIGRRLLLSITELGLPTATEFLDPIIPQYIADFVSWASIGARTTESQTHRQMASGLSMPVGFKNGTDGNLQVAVDAMSAAMRQHSFVGIDQDGITSIFRTTGNPWGHVVLRGGRKKTNYDAESIREAVEAMTKASLPAVLMVDCSHANSAKQPARQEIVWESVLKQRIAGEKSLIGLMAESYLCEGTQPIPTDLNELHYGISITDPCIGWETTVRMLEMADKTLRTGL
ncbi:MAG: 3-deoxy-7-phosphoheptulonate synthase [bacterium]